MMPRLSSSPSSSVANTMATLWPPDEKTKGDPFLPTFSAGAIADRPRPPETQSGFARSRQVSDLGPSRQVVLPSCCPHRADP
jgi:hypothetical protein